MEILNTPATSSDHGNCPARSQMAERFERHPPPAAASAPGEVRRHGKGCGELTGAIGGDHAFRRLSAEALGRPGLLARNQPRAHSLSWLVHAKLYLSEPTCDSRSQLSASHSQATQGGARDRKDTCMASSIWTSFNQVSVRLSNPDSALHRLSFLKCSVPYAKLKTKVVRQRKKEDSYCGLVAIPKNDCDLPSWLNTIFEVISWQCGIMKNVLPYIKEITSHQSYYPRSKRDEHPRRPSHGLPRVD